MYARYFTCSLAPLARSIVETLAGAKIAQLDRALCLERQAMRPVARERVAFFCLGYGRDIYALLALGHFCVW